ncbi:hypothetical protein [Chitinophaga sp. HK235]|uniref:hypothetical protein n=1 Tax=Chitinophaga sp. HK235 TaxID=2952571 RepID=UPI001BACFF63|nr:hypothetical protein [Chitinophaga sp. HK235]
MKNVYLFILMLTGVLFVSCKKDKIAYDNDFKKSYDTWINFKASSNNTYRYGVSFASWTGSSSVTVITVKEGKVIERSYTAKHRDPATNQVVTNEEWTEDESALGSHIPGFSMLTLDEIYKKAKDEWLIKRDNANNYFEAKNDGMISSCGYVENTCADDCSVGVNIIFIEKI